MKGFVTGIIAELRGNTDTAIEVDSLNPAVLTDSLPEGVTVTLSTGQTFKRP